MTIGGAIAELQNLINADDVPFYYKGGIEKVIETILLELPSRAEGEWIVNEDLPKLDNTFVIDCSICGKGMFAHYNDDYPNYCYNYGAKMKEVEE